MSWLLSDDEINEIRCGGEGIIENPYLVFIKGLNEIERPFGFDRLDVVAQIRILGKHEGWDEAIAALIKWGDGDCTDTRHGHSVSNDEQRRFCIGCWLELREKYGAKKEAA